MKQEDFELEAKDAAKAMLKKKAPTRPETFERPRKTGKRLTPRGIQPTVVEEIKDCRHTERIERCPHL